MLKILFLLLPVFLLGEITSNDLYLCNQSDYSKCEEIGIKYLTKFGSDYNVDRAEFPLKKSCIYGNSSKSCYMLSNFYYSKKDYSARERYLKKSCDLGDSSACYYYNQLRVE